MEKNAINTPTSDIQVSLEFPLLSEHEKHVNKCHEKLK